MKTLISTLCVLCCFTMQSQKENDTQLPYKEIPKYPEKYTTGTVISRMIDGLGYRFYWATEGLRQEDLSYKPSKKSRTTEETLQHIYGLSETILNAPMQRANIRPADWSYLSFEQLRNSTLQNFKKASDLLLKMSDADVSKLEIAFKRQKKEFKAPYWNMLNGPLADAIYHTGQIVTFRRSSGNPMNPKVNVFMGKTGE